MITLKDNTILCAFDANDDNGGNSVIKVVRSTDDGLTWSSSDAKVVSSTADRNCANPTLFQMDNGDILIAYRAMIDKTGGKRDSAIKVSISTDNGYTWRDHSTVISYLHNAGGGVYEPCFVSIGGKLTEFFANDSVGPGNSIGIGKDGGGNDQPAVTSLSYQNIEYLQWSGSAWTNRTIACNGTNSGSRDGMPTVAQLSNGNWILGYEANNYNGHPFVLRFKVSANGTTWDTSVATGKGTVFSIPKITGRKVSGPQFLVLPGSGRVAAGYQTDDDATVAGDQYSAMRVMISDSATAENWGSASGWGEIYDIFDTPANKYSLWNGMAVHKNYIFALTSTNWPNNSIRIRRADISNLPAAS